MVNEANKCPGTKRRKVMPLSNKVQNSNCTVEKIRIIVSRQDHNKKVAFIMRKKTPMKLFMRRYSKYIGVPAPCIRFLFDGYKINDLDTPNSLQMKQNDVLEAYQLAFDGGKCYFKSLSSN